MDFLQFVKQKCNDSGVTLVLSPADYVQTDCGIRCNGYFDDKSATLAVATGKSEAQWLKTLVHEYAHMTQWQANTTAWDLATYPTDAEDIVELWYDRKIELTLVQRDHWIGLARDVEAEAERRALGLISVHRLGIDPIEYTQHANAYLYFWTYTGKSRRWYTIGKEPYNIPEIVREMPTTPNVDHSHLPARFERLFSRYC